MPRPLEHVDPPQVGPFRLHSRLHESAAGIVYLGVDPHGRPVTVALLTWGAADDAAARDRFRAAIGAELPVPVPGAPPPPPAAGDAVVAARPDGAAPWVATLHQDGRPGAGRFLDPVLFKGRWSERVRRGPTFRPYWVESNAPALAPPPRPNDATAGTERGLIATIVTLAGVLGVMGVLLVALFSCGPITEPESVPVPLPSTAQTTQGPSSTPTSIRPTPSPSRSGRSLTPVPTRGPGDGDPV